MGSPARGRRARGRSPPRVPARGGREGGGARTEGSARGEPRAKRKGGGRRARRRRTRSARAESRSTTTGVACARVNHVGGIRGGWGAGRAPPRSRVRAGVSPLARCSNSRPFVGRRRARFASRPARGEGEGPRWWGRGSARRRLNPRRGATVCTEFGDPRRAGFRARNARAIVARAPRRTIHDQRAARREGRGERGAVIAHLAQEAHGDLPGAHFAVGRVFFLLSASAGNLSPRRRIRCVALPRSRGARRRRRASAGRPSECARPSTRAGASGCAAPRPRKTKGRAQRRCAALSTPALSHTKVLSVSTSGCLRVRRRDVKPALSGLRSERALRVRFTVPGIQQCFHCASRSMQTGSTFSFPKDGTRRR